MPYWHFHGGKYHRHRRRRKGGSHWRAVRRRQRPWRVGFAALVVVLVVGAGAWLALRPADLPLQLDALLPTPGPTKVLQLSEPTQAATDAKHRTPTTASALATAEVQVQVKVLELERRIHDLINECRAALGRHPLKWDDRLASIARAHSDDMVARQYFAHGTPEGLDATDRLHRAGQRCRKGRYYGIGENIAIETNLLTIQKTAADAVEGWMSSPGHRDNLLKADYDTTGVGAAFGDWRGYRAVYLTQVFC